MRQAAEPAAVRRPTYKGNVGNLMQHWTLCETLSVVQRHVSCLSYVDAHAMAPVAWRRDAENKVFDRVRDSERPKSAYERAWWRLAPGRQGYPNSAAFVRNLWDGRVAMLLCEIDSSTAAEVGAWAVERTGVTVVDGDWRTRFEQGLPDAPMTLLSFDPYMYDRRRDVTDPGKGNLYPPDLELTVDALDAVRGGVLVQLSTYGTQAGNSQDAAIASVNAILDEGRLRPVAVVRANRKMMSLVYARGIDWFAELADMPQRFRRWLEAHR